MQLRMLAFLALTLLAGMAALGQTAEAPEPSEETALATELSRLNSTLVEIKALLEQVTETQSLDLLLKRMELSSAQVAEAQKQLRNAESERAAVENERARLEMSAQSFAAELESGSLEAAEQLEAFTTRHETAMARLEARLRTLNDEIAMLGNLLSTKQRELEDWQSHIDRRLGDL